MDFSLSQWFDSFKHLDTYFKYLGLVSGVTGWLTFFVSLFLIIGIFLQRKTKVAIVFLLIWLACIISLGIGKVADSHDSLFFSGVRFFLAFPLIMGLILLNFFQAPKRISYRFCLLVAILLIFVSGYKVSVFYNKYPDIDKLGRLQWVAVEEVTNIKHSCDEIKRISDEQNVDLVVFHDDEDQLLNYACPCMVKNFPTTVFPLYERRTWVLTQLAGEVYPNVLFISPASSDTTIRSLKKIGRDAYLLDQNLLSTDSLLRSYHYKIRPYPGQGSKRMVIEP
jgi:4-amino-4-deoxy-L-arabinose transferase-like glycosyltransferase